MSSLPGYGQRLVAFPGAEGAGKYTSGGRGTTAVPTVVFAVTSLADTNTPGTLRYALSQPATAAPHRTVVFRVCGTIHLTSGLRIPANTTLAGQTAPGAGICLADQEVTVNGNNVIVRFMRFRLGDRYQNGGMVNGSGDDDAFGGRFNTKTIIDHCSMSWSTDEAFSFYQGDSTTLQWNLISEPLNYSYHFETGDTDFEEHGYGGVWGSRNGSFHHNLIAHCKGRMPRFSGSGGLTPAVQGAEKCDFRNNVIYNWVSYSTNGGEGGYYNVVNNYYKYGPNTQTASTSGVPRRQMIMNPSISATLPYPQVYLAGNYVDGSAAVTTRNWRGIAMAGGTPADTVQSKASTPFSVIAVPTQTATDAYEAVLNNAGCVLPARDTLDQRIVNNVRNRTGRVIDVQGGYPHGTPYSTSQGAWPALTCGAAPPDTDQDGMPDAWETSHGLNPTNAADRQGLAPNGYTNLENYLNGLAAVVMGTKPPTKALRLGVYPNPAQTQLTLTHPVSRQPAQAEVFAFDGRRVATLLIAAGTTETSVALHQLMRGNYFIRYSGEAGELSAKVMRN
ncbi:T9SS type A sorting domain-containing protein [Hymenobacter sp. BT186]|uniref:T9SS type A sorting domain-containing protein n=1 Tax=Hymenobacter telluris TaxID=2816474 RepID=A0A939JAJ5_9BACT|nr:T9SS type A sorting domain-containing protein [Hymenobacter telluris]MBO0358166.1 T9SS type A sorting domain-containing protein [Hymenobacter telluris]MBW3374193.1 T9SS type A sorting domain-containing protein [Hymenobacter norwichensis]